MRRQDGGRLIITARLYSICAKCLKPISPGLTIERVKDVGKTKGLVILIWVHVKCKDEYYIYTIDDMYHGGVTDNQYLPADGGYRDPDDYSGTPPIVCTPQQQYDPSFNPPSSIRSNRQGESGGSRVSSMGMGSFGPSVDIAVSISTVLCILENIHLD